MLLAKNHTFCVCPQHFAIVCQHVIITLDSKAIKESGANLPSLCLKNKQKHKVESTCFESQWAPTTFQSKASGTNLTKRFLFSLHLSIATKTKANWNKSTDWHDLFIASPLSSFSVKLHAMPHTTCPYITFAKKPFKRYLKMCCEIKFLVTSIYVGGHGREYWQEVIDMNPG